MRALRMNCNSIVVKHRVSHFILQKNCFFFRVERQNGFLPIIAIKRENRRRVKVGTAEPFISTLDAATVFAICLQIMLNYSIKTVFSSGSLKRSSFLVTSHETVLGGSRDTPFAFNSS